MSPDRRGRSVATPGDHPASPSAGLASGSDDPGSAAPAGVGPWGIVPAGLAEPATAGVALATAAYLSVFLSITDIVGGTGRVLVAVALAGIAGVAVARVLTERLAVGVSGVLLAGGLTGYYFAVPASQRALFSVENLVFDTVALFTGLSVLRLAAADVWVLAVAPVPTFLAWYLAARGRGLAGSVVGGAALSFFVLTGDAGTATTLLGAVGVAVAAGATTLSVPGGYDTGWNTLAVVLAAMVLLSATLTVVPGGAAQPWTSGGGASGIESSLVGDQERLDIVGPVQLSPEVRFTVESTQEAYWQTGSFDRYTGDGWVSTGESTPYSGELDGPPGTTVRIEQTIRPETEMNALPSAWRPVSVEGPVARSAQVGPSGTLQPGTTLLEDDAVTVESEVLQATPEELRAADTDYPDEIEDRYTQLPESTPDRVGDLTAEIIDEADADNPYDQARAIERYLEETKEYSLNVQQPEGDIADGFLFEMDAGYCTYFATAMVAMLRSQGVPAKFVTGYGSGERVSQDEWVVRGQDAHAWVMVYFPEYGWVEFDPTPSAERDEARDTRLAEARQAGDEGVDTDETGEEQSERTADDIEGADDVGTPENETDGPDADGADDVPEIDGGEEEMVGPGEEGIGDVRPDEDPGLAPGPNGEVPGDTVDADDHEAEDGPLPDSQTIGYGLLLLFGLVAAAHHAGATRRAYREAWLRVPVRRSDPVRDVERAYARLEYLLERRYRPRRPGETPRAYIQALQLRGIDERAVTVAETYEQAVYAGDIDRETADSTIRTVRRLALEATPVVRRLL